MTESEKIEIERISHLARRFPSLAHVASVENWAPLKLARWADAASHGERMAVQFILGVWNQHEHWPCGQFNVLEAYNVWDEKHWSAFRSWVEEPFVL